MSVVTAQRKRDVGVLRDRLVVWAERAPTVRGVAMVGSWARGEPRMDSDVDLIVVTVDPSPFLGDARWVEAATGQPAPIVRTMAWGPLLTERRVRLRSGLEVEFGFTTPRWTDTNPLDPGTKRVVSDGCVVLFDPEGLFHVVLDHLGDEQEPGR